MPLHVGGPSTRQTQRSTRNLNTTTELRIKLSPSVSKCNYIQISSCTRFSQYGFLPEARTSSVSPQPGLASLPQGPAGQQGGAVLASSVSQKLAFYKHYCSAVLLLLLFIVGKRSVLFGKGSKQSINTQVTCLHDMLTCHLPSAGSEARTRVEAGTSVTSRVPRDSPLKP